MVEENDNLKLLTQRQVSRQAPRIVLEVAEIKPYKKRRLKEIARKRKDLLQKLNETGLILAHGC
jgi:hypothetical protein